MSGFKFDQKIKSLIADFDDPVLSHLYDFFSDIAKKRNIFVVFLMNKKWSKFEHLFPHVWRLVSQAILDILGKILQSQSTQHTLQGILGDLGISD